MNKKTIFLTAILTTIFTGCSSYSITKYFDKDEYYNKSIQYTKKADINEGTTIKMMMNVTYLNSVLDEYDNEQQNFVVGIYNSKDENNQTLQNSDYGLFMNDNKPSKIKLLSKDDQLIQSIALKNHWATYYLVSFDKEKTSLLEEENHTLIVSYENIKERKIYLEQKALEDEKKALESILDEEKPSTLKQAQKASVSFLKEL